MSNKAILIGHPSVALSAAISELKAKGEDFIVVDINNKEQMEEIAKMHNIAFEPPPTPFTNPYRKLDELQKPFVYQDDFIGGQKKFRKQNNRKHKNQDDEHRRYNT